MTNSLYLSLFLRFALLRALMKIGNEVRWYACGPRGGFGAGVEGANPTNTKPDFKRSGFSCSVEFLVPWGGLKMVIDL